MKRFTATLLALVLCLCMIVPASAASGAGFTIGAGEANVGDTIYLPVNFVSDEPVKAIGLGPIEYDSSVLEFVGFENQAEFATKPVFETYNKDKGIISLGWLEAQDLSAGVKVCDLCFKVIGKGNITVSGTPVVRDASSNAVTTDKPTANVSASMQKITGVTFEGASYTYDGTEKVLAVSGTLPEGTSVSYSNEKATNAGTYNATATVTCTGYDDLVLNATLTIAPRALTVSGLSAQDKTYDGTDAAVLSGGTVSGAVAGDDVSVEVPTTGKFASRDAGSNIAVSMDDVALSGAAKGNYTLEQSAGLTANIAKAELSVKANDAQMIKGDVLPALGYTVTGGKLFGDDQLSGSLSVSTDGQKVGTFEIRQGTLTAGDNYELAFTNGTLTVSDKTPQNITVSEISEKTYGDAAFQITVTADAASGLNEFTFESSDPDVASVDASGNVTVKAAGTASITVKQAGNDTYAAYENTQLLKVNKVAIVVTADAQTKRLGAADPALTYTYTGTLVGDDTFTGALERKSGETLGSYDILQGTLALSDNYILTYNKATLEIVDKTPQSITVSEISEKTYGDAAFQITVTADAASGLNEFTFESSDPDVASVDASGNVTIKAAGTASITVKQAGNDTYAAYENTQILKVNKVAIVVTADAQTKRLGAADPALTYTYTGTLVGDDTFTGALERKSGETLGSYDILQGTLALSDNYTLTYNKATLEIVDKTPQSITVSEISEKTYGDAAFQLTVTADAASGLNEFTFESSDPDVASVDASGNVTIKAAGTASITVKQAGNDTYAAYESTQTLTVNRKAVTVSAIDLEAQTATLVGVLDADAAVVLDFAKVTFAVVENIDDATVKAAVTGLLLTGEKSENYVVTTESVETTIAAAKVATVTVEADKGTVEGAGSYLIGSTVTLTAKPNSGYRFSGWYAGETLVSSESSYTFTLDSDTALMVKFSKKSSGGGGSSSKPTTKPETKPETNVPEVVNPFEDVAEGAYYYDAVLWAVEKSITGGTTATTFSPDASCTRAQLVTFLWRATGSPVVDYTVEFADVVDGAYYCEAVRWAASLGIVGGYGNGLFGTDDTITREQVVTILYRYATAMKMDVSAGADTNILSYNDALEVADYAFDAFQWACGEGIMTGYNGNLMPKDSCVRAQIVTMLYRLLGE